MSWISDVSKEIKELNLSRKSLRKFGLFVGAVFLAIGVVMEIKHSASEWRYIFIGLGALLIIVGATYPAALKYAYKFWMGIAFAIGWIVSRILLSVIYYIIVTPIGLIMRLFGKTPLKKHADESADTYWIPKDAVELNIENYKKMY